MLAIEVVFLTGRYTATAYNTRGRGEWPPHPARLFSALVAAHFGGDSDSPDGLQERHMLEWLELHRPPYIHASTATSRDVVTVFVPVNDAGLTNVDGDGAKLEDARASLAASEATGDAQAVLKHTKAVAKAEALLKKAIARAIDVPVKPLNPRVGERVLPEHRVRQPRTFPSVTPEIPRVTYAWPDADPTQEQRNLLDGLLRRVVRIGHSSSLVSTRIVDIADLPAWRPSPNGEATFRVVEPGQLRALEQAFQRHREVEPRVMPAVHQRYTQGREEGAEFPLCSVLSADWLVLRRVEGPFLPMTAAAGVARSVRRTLMPSQQPHLAVVPLPFVGHAHALRCHSRHRAGAATQCERRRPAVCVHRRRRVGAEASSGGRGDASGSGQSGRCRSAVSRTGRVALGTDFAQGRRVVHAFDGLVLRDAPRSRQESRRSPLEGLGQAGRRCRRGQTSRFDGLRTNRAADAALRRDPAGGPLGWCGKDQELSSVPDGHNRTYAAGSDPCSPGV